MEIYERIRFLRKKELHLSQTEFGNRLGVSRSVIKNIELNTLARPEQKLSLIKLICKEFTVNEDWLLYGKEPMFSEPDVFNLNDFAKQHGATDLELEIIKAYFELEPDTRKALVEHFKSRLAPVIEELALTNTKPEKTTVEEAEEEYIKSRLALAKKTERFASSTIGESDKRNPSNKVSNQ